MRQEILEDTAKRCVYPNRISIGMGVAQADVRLVKGFNPEGVLFVRVVRANDLPKKGKNVPQIVHMRLLNICPINI